MSQPLDTYFSLCTQVYDLSKPKPPQESYDFYRQYAQAVKGPLLEPMCGTGRFLLPLLEEGFEIHGFDASPHMLESLHQKAESTQLKPKVWQGFVNDFNQAERYKLIFIPSGSFGLLTDLKEAGKALEIFYHHLAPGGLLVFEAETLFAVPSIMETWRGSMWKKPDGDMIIASFLDLLPQDNVGTTICKYELIQQHQIIQTEIEQLKVRLYHPDQMINMLKAAGFNEIRMRKSFDSSSEPAPQDELVIYECKK